MSAPIRRRRALAALLAAITTAATVLLGGPAAAAPPMTPVLVGPTDAGTTSSTAPTLSVTATDPDGGAVPVRFEGRKLGATTPAPGTGDPFTLVALPDTQNYTYGDRQATIPQQTEWIASTRTALKTAFVVQLGDLVSDWFNPQQWQYISDGLRVLDNAGIPNSVVPGNHDFDNIAQDVGPYDTWFPVSRYANASWNGPAARYGGFLGQNQFGADAVDRRNMDNYSLFTAGGRDFLVLNLEWEAPQYALDWAHRVLTAHPDRLAIMVTHSFVTVAGGRRTTAERTGGTPTATLWSDFVAQHCSIRVVLSGHEHSGDAGEARRTDANSCGNPVHQILTDYQSRANGGDGWLRYYTFDPAANTMRATTYSPKLGTYETDADSAFTVPLDLGTSTPAPFITIGTTSVTSGQTASVRWTGLDPDTRYEWRAVAGAPGETATSPVWTLRTPTAVGGVNDTFTRALTGGWGSADTGQRWSTVSASAFSVDGTRGRFSVPTGGSRRAQLDEVSLRDVLVSTDVAVTPAPTGSGVYFSLQGRSVSSGQYRAKLRFVAGGTVTIGLIKVIGGVETALSPERPVGTVSAGAPVNVQLELTGSAPTALRAKAWPSTTAEPTGWTVTGTDSTAALQGPGAVGLETYVSSSATAPITVSMDRFLAAATGTPPPVNQRPTAVIRTPTITERAVTLTAADSTDPDGTITGWAWNFGDGTTATGQNTNHTYTADGSYPITLTVTDNQGATDTATRTVTVAATPPPVNQAPTAVIRTPTITERAVTLTAADSTDPDGTITGWAWNFGDGTTATGQNTNHTYTADGSYPITLTVTDNQGATDTATRTVTVAATPPPVNQAPTAVIRTPTITERAVTLTAADSTDPDGTITGWAWNFGDGTTATGQNTNHTYTADGSYPITLTVTDNQGATDTATRTVTVAATPPPVNQAPTAVIRTPTITERAVTLTAADSTDPDGTITGWAWNFGDGTTATGQNTNHTYTADGSYPITLTVTDNQGATDTATRTVTVAATPPPVTDIAADTFSRTVSRAWGTATTGGSWNAIGSPDRFSVTAGVGRQTTPAGQGADATLPAVQTRSAELRVAISWDRPASESRLYSTVVVRGAASGSYRATLNIEPTGVPRISLVRRVGSTDTTLKVANVPGTTMTPGAWYQLSVRATPGAGGTTVLSAKAWPRGGTEPAAAQVTAIDGTAGLQAAGWVGVGSYRSSGASVAVTTSFDDLRVTPVA
ncbi:MAG: PKD domain-containing protein [Nakamurella sp.]